MYTGIYSVNVIYALPFLNLVRAYKHASYTTCSRRFAMHEQSINVYRKPGLKSPT